MVSVRVTTARLEHAAQLAPLMRPADVAECLAAGYPDARTALEVSLTNSDFAWVVLFDGEVAAMLGVSEFHEEPGAALVWALTGRAVNRARLSFVRESHRLLTVLLGCYSRLINLVDERYQGALDWLECLGFTIGPVVPHPSTGAAFRVASIRRVHAVEV